ncbi:MAG: helix-turn-helix domain-containing protein [Ruminococcus sp.]|jgi:SOS-response transcriptional repressors (recA-mediated autopeptidases)|nr:helix-turn-helix domain-containing protein [Ruminococcus sp.]
MNIGDIMRTRRQELGLTLEEVGDYVGVGKSTVRKWEHGDIENMKRDKIALLSKILKLSPLTFITGEVEYGTPDNIIPLPKMKKIPLLGTIACGEPILATENIEALINADKNLNADFALRCKGDSMINARIFDGDIVYIREQPDVEDGEIAAVLIGEEATLKRVYKYPSKVVLRPENPLYDDMIYSKEEMNEVRILGKAVAFLSAVR